MAIRSKHFSGDRRIASASENRPVMRRGETGRGVELVQEALVIIGYPMPISMRADGSLDGIFGRETEAVVKRFQTSEGLVGDGLVGRNTIRRLDDILAAREAREARAKRPLIASHWEMSTARNARS
jgi:peptidoglycan hydrolase-like protein with peptidoglycan-binding domain